MKKTYYLLCVLDNTEPELHGPFAKESQRDSSAKELRARHGDDHGLFPVDLGGRERIRVGTYSGGFFEEGE